MVTHVLKGVEGCKSVGNRTNGKDLVKVAYNRVLSIRHDVNAWCAAWHEPGLWLVTQNSKTNSNNSGNPEFTSEIGN